MGCHFLLQGIFPTQGLNLSLPHCRQTLHHLSHQAGKVVKNLPANAGDTRDGCLIHGLERSPGGGHSNPLQCSCLENPMDREAWSNLAHTHVRYVSWPFTPKYFTIIFLRVRSILLYNHIAVINSVNLTRIKYFNLWFVFKLCWLMNSIIVLPTLQKLVYRQVLHLIVICF